MQYTYEVRTAALTRHADQVVATMLRRRPGLQIYGKVMFAWDFRLFATIVAIQVARSIPIKFSFSLRDLSALVVHQAEAAVTVTRLRQGLGGSLPLSGVEIRQEHMVALGLHISLIW